jgi:GNAT superfamily N-acetyltransferase
VAGYRFCRSDDAQRLVEAYNVCYRVHFPELPELTLDGFKRWVREIQVWASSCMIASGDRGEPIGVLIGAKRETANCVIALGVHPDHLRQGHGSHMLQSLSSKLAILGPPRIVAEVPERLRSAEGCFEVCGFRVQATYSDFVLEVAARIAGTEAHHSLVSPIRLDDAIDAGLLENRDHPVCWERWREGLIARQQRLHGLAVASEARIEAAMLYSVEESASQECQIELVHLAEPRAGEKLFRVMLDDQRRGRGKLVFRRVHQAEVSFELLERVGFRPRGRISGYVVDGTI